MPRKKLHILLCDDQHRYADEFKEHNGRYFETSTCYDIHSLLDQLREMEDRQALPDVLLLDLFSRRDDVQEDDHFVAKRDEIDEEVTQIRGLLEDINQKARTILYPHGIDILKDIRREYPEYKLPILLYSRLGPYLLEADESAVVDDFNAEFLLKLLGHDEQRKKIRRFFYKWRSQHQPSELEISRKLSSLPPALADAVWPALKNRQYQQAIVAGFQELDHFVRESVSFEHDGYMLRNHLRTALFRSGRRRPGETAEHFRSRAHQAVPDLYYSVFILIRSFHVHGKRPQARKWREVDMCLSVYALIWREVQELVRMPAEPYRQMIMACDVRRIAGFYKDVLGCEIEQLTDEWAELAAGDDGINLVISRTVEDGPLISAAVAFAVTDCAALTERLRGKGVNLVKEYEASCGGYVTQVQDPEGRIVSFYEKGQRPQ